MNLQGTRTTAVTGLDGRVQRYASEPQTGRGNTRQTRP